MPKPTFIGVQNTSSYFASASPKTTPILTCQAGDRLLAYTVCRKNDTNTAMNITDSTGLTWTVVQTVNLGASPLLKVWTAVATGNLTVTFTRTTGSGGAYAFGGSVLALRDTTGIGASAKSTTVTGSANTVPATLPITTTQLSSAILTVIGDFTGDEGTTIFRTDAGAVTTLTDEVAEGVNGARVGISDDSGITGTYTVGLTSPPMTNWVVINVEIKGTTNVVLSLQNIAQGQNLGTLGLNVDTLVSSLGQAQSIENVLLDITTAVTVQGLGQVQSLGTPVLGVYIVVNSLAQGQTLETVVIYTDISINTLNVGQTQSLETVPGLAASSTGTGAIATLYILPPSGQAAVTNPPNSENNFIVENIFYSGNDLVIGVDSELILEHITQAQSLEELTLVQAHVIAVQNLIQIQALQTIALLQNHILVVQNMGQGQNFGTVLLNQDTFIFVNSLAQEQAIGNIALTEQAILTIDSIIQNLELENINILQNNFLSLADVYIEQVLSEPDVAQSYILILQNIASFQSLDNIVILTYDNYTIGRLVYVLENEKIIHVLEN